MRTCGAPYSEYTIPNACMLVRHTTWITLMQTTFSYSHCTDLYSSLMYIALWEPQTVYINHEVPWRPLQLVYDSEKEHGIATLQSDHYDANHIFLNTL